MSTHAFTPRRFATLFESDARNITRDPTLLYVIVLSILPAVLGYFFRDWINSAVQSQFGLAGIFEMVLPMFLCIPAFLIGWVTGFLFLEDRDEGPLLAVDVTPLGKRGFMVYRVAVTAAVTFVVTLFGCALLLPEHGVATALVLAVTVTFEAIGIALALPALARNKVEGLALIKVANVFSMAALLALVPGPWRFLGAWIPTFWVGELVLNAPDFPATLFFVDAALGIATHLAAVLLLYRLQARRAG